MSPSLSLTHWKLSNYTLLCVEHHKPPCHQKTPYLDENKPRIGENVINSIQTAQVGQLQIQLGYMLVWDHEGREGMALFSVKEEQDGKAIQF